MNRNNIIKHIDLWKSKLGSYSDVAKKCNISPSSLSLLLSGKYGAKETSLLKTIATALNYKETDWQLVRSIGNYTNILKAVQDAKQESMWFAVSNKAGSGKTGTLEDIFNQDTSGTVIFIQAEEWSGREFLMKIIEKTMGESALKGKYKSLSMLLDMVCNYFNEMSFERPVLLIDEADKLKPGAFRALIPIYNRTEDRLGLVMSGTENLEKEITTGVRLSKKGFDEIESRICRKYITLNGATQKEVHQICEANGVTDPLTKETIWTEIEKVKKMVSVVTPKGEKEALIEFTEDFRRLKRLIKREKLLLKNKG